MGIEMFENNERILINHLTNGVDVSKIEKKSIITSLDVAINMCEGDVLELTENTRTKINLLTDGEWDNLRKSLPLECVEPTNDTMEDDGFAVDENGVVIEI